tara:strand:+ start:731 stop:883 length:153 start_codon:yes stop_codon:yes gene_type:complete
MAPDKSDPAAALAARTTVEVGGPSRHMFTESRKTFDPKAIYGDSPNPTQL